MDRRRAKRVVLCGEAAKALASPLRMEILERIRAEGECTAARLGELMDRPPDRLYYHLRMLIRAGVLEEAPGISGREAIFRATPGEIGLGLDPRDPAAMEVGVRAVHALLRQAMRDFEAAAASGDLAELGCHELGRRHRIWLTDDDLAEVMRRLTRIGAFVESRSTRKEGRQYRWLSLVVPVEGRGENTR